MERLAYRRSLDGAVVTQLILIVEDNEQEQYVLAALLRKFDYEPYVVASAEEALDALAGNSFAAILLDITLPGMDGYECARRIRNSDDKSLRSTAIIALTARARPEDRQQCLLAGMNDYLSKPFSPENLRRILLRWVYQVNRPNLKVLRPLEDEPCLDE